MGSDIRQSVPALMVCSLQVIWSVVRSNGAVSGLLDVLFPAIYLFGPTADCFEAIPRVFRTLKVVDSSCLAGGTSLWSSSPTDSGHLE